MKLLERDIQKKCVAYARANGWWARKFTAQGRRSAPDYIFAKEGFVFFDEFKATGGMPTELQLEEHKEMRAAGLVVHVHDDPEKFRATLADYEPVPRMHTFWGRVRMAEAFSK